MILVDFIFVNCSYLASIYLHYLDYSVMPRDIIDKLIIRMPYVTLVYLGVFAIAKLYANLWRYMGFLELTKTVISAGIGTAICFLIDYICMKSGELFALEFEHAINPSEQCVQIFKDEVV